MDCNSLIASHVFASGPTNLSHFTDCLRLFVRRASAGSLVGF